MRETTVTERRNHTKTFFDAVEEGEPHELHRHGQ